MSARWSIRRRKPASKSSTRFRSRHSRGSVGQHLRKGDQAFVADYVDQAAGQIERFAGYLENRSVDELMYDAERFARRQPAMFLGGAFVLGVLAARFLKSSAAATAPRYGGREYGRYGPRAGYTPQADYNPYSSDYAMYGGAQRPPYEPTV